MTQPIVRGRMVQHFSSDGSSGHRQTEEPLEIALFGSLSARRAGVDLALRLPRNALRMLAYLLLHRERAQPRERVAFALWPDDEEAAARANLRRQLHLLQRALPETPGGWIVTSAATIGWNLRAPLRLDVAEFERLSADVSTADAADLLYCGDVLPELDDDWLVHERDRLRTLALANCSALVTRNWQRRDFRTAIRYAQRLRGLDPWREDAVRALIAVRLEAGDRAGALAEYERFRDVLAREMGVDPMPETVCAYERAVADAGSPENVSSEATPAQAPRTPLRWLPFVGRSAELERLCADWSVASSGSGTTTLVVGEAGIGKSRLIDALAAHVDSNGGRILRGGTSPFEVGPYQVIAEALRGALPMLRKANIEPMWLAALTPLVPQLAADVPALPRLVPLEAEAERTRLFEAVVIAIAALADVRPLLIVLEDLHWAGSATIGLVEYVIRRATGKRALIVGSYREDDLSNAGPLRALRRRLERERLLRVAALGALGAADVAEIVGEFVADDSAHRAALARELLVTSDGNPFLLGELLINARESGALDIANRRWNRAAVATAALPSLTTTLSERLERLPPRARSLAEIASVIGRSFSAELVREVSGVDERTALDSLSELVDHRLVREVDAGSTDFAFSHQLIQQTVYANMSPDARTRRHRRVGNLIEEIYSEQIEQFAAELAAHYDQGSEPERGAEYYRLAARQALGLYGNDEAKSLASRGLELVNGGETRMALLEIREEAHRRLGERDEQRTVVAEMLALAQTIDRPTMLYEALRRRVLLAHACAERDDERTAIAALEVQTRSARAPWPAIVAGLKGSYLLSIGAYEEARRSITQAMVSPSIRDYPKLYVECRCTLVELAGFAGRIDEIRDFLTTLASEDEPRYDDALRATLLETACSAASRIQDYPALARIAEQLRECSRAIGYREGEAAAYKYAGRAAMRLFEPDRARVFLSHALQMFEALGQRLQSIHVLADIGNLATSVGQFDEAIARLTDAEAIAASISYRFGQAACANNISYAAYLQGDFAHARITAERALAAAIEINAPSARAHASVSLGVAKRELGDAAAAVVDIEAGIVLERSLGERVALGEDLCELIIALVRAGDVPGALARATEVLDLLDDTVAVTHPQFLLWSAAAAYYASGDAARASLLLGRAHTSLEERQNDIRDDASRATFRRLPFNRAIDRAVTTGVWEI